jgi:two-component system chemotaxis sensor kinase CheA
MDLSQFKQKFITEAGDLLTGLDNILIKLEKEPLDKALIDEAFRIMHTIKGTSGMYGFDRIVEITHEIESLYDMVRSHQMQVSPMLVEITFASADHIRNLLSESETEEIINRHLKLKANINLIKSSSGIENSASMATEKISSKSETATWNILFYPNDELIKRCVNLIYTFQDLFALGTYQIQSSPFSQIGNDVWSIFLITDKSYDDIESALLFISDYCKIVKIADFNIFEPSAIDRREEEIRKAERASHRESVAPVPQRSKRKVSEMTQEVLQSLNETKDSGVKQQVLTSLNRIHVDTQKLDKLMYLVSELVTTKSELLLALQRNNEEKALDAAEKIEKLSKLFSNNALDIRLVSLHDMINRFKRLVRDLAKQLGKNIDFVTVGEDTELDKSIIDIIGEPIMHLIRNCIDHGIETPGKRLERNKPENGIIRFEATKEGNYVYITISDDGNGIDPAYIYQKAVEKGFIAEGTQLSEKEVFNLIFLPGFSTAQTLTDVSGRGVGMDIVLRKIQEIRGEITINSDREKGTSFTIKIQQTISIIDTLLVSSAGTTYAIPVEDIDACELEADEKMISSQSNLIVYNNQLIPFLNLRTSFSNGGLTTGREKIIVINRQNKYYAIVADTIIGEYQAVVKPLGKTFCNIKFLSGASILGDGSIALLLDTDKLRFEITSEVEHKNIN